MPLVCGSLQSPLDLVQGCVVREVLTANQDPLLSIEPVLQFAGGEPKLPPLRPPESAYHLSHGQDHIRAIGAKGASGSSFATFSGPCFSCVYDLVTFLRSEQDPCKVPGAPLVPNALETFAVNQYELANLIMDSPAVQAFRFVNKRWWHYNDGYWEQSTATIYLDGVIMRAAQRENWLQGGNMYMITRVRSVLAGYLATSRLPGRLEPPRPSSTGPASELPAPADRPEPGQPSPPAPHPAAPTQEQVDQAGTAAPTGHTP
jgi:hypothetical protein